MSGNLNDWHQQRGRRMQVLQACQQICVLLGEDMLAQIDGVGDEIFEQKRATLVHLLQQLAGGPVT